MVRSHPFNRLCIVATCSVILCAGVVYTTIGPVVPRSLLAKIRRGTPKSEVREVLGEPNESSSRDEWTYSRPLNQGWVTVRFDDQECVNDINDESVFP
jgi:outer membrane protein assembly factor BamE (lipoprotein component of BamABCDE complex)